MFALLIAIIASASIAASASGGGGGGGGSSTSTTSTSTTTTTTTTSVDPDTYRTDEYNAQYGLDQIGAADAYASLETDGLTIAGDGVKVSIVDSGAQTDHVEIANNFDSTDSYDYVGSDSDVSDGNGHGTHVASTAAGVKDNSGMHGVAYGATIIVKRVLNDAGTGSASNVASAITQSASDGAKVINLSLGSSFESSLITTSLINAKNADVVIVAATGNNAASQPLYPADSAINSSIQGYEIAVGAVDSNSDLYTDSNHCGDTQEYCLVAPGVSVYAAMPVGSTIQSNSAYGCDSSGYCTITGTSMATPHVAGAAAVIRGAWPLLTSPEVVQILLNSATDLGDEGVDAIYGHGLLNLYAAVQASGSTSISSGLSFSSAGYDVGTTSISVDPIFGDAFSLNVASQLNSAVFFDDYGRDFRANLADKISQTSSVTVPNLDSFAFNNNDTKIVPLSFGKNLSSKLKIQVNAYKDTAQNENYLDRGYSENNFGLKFLITDNSKEDKYLNSSQGFSFSQDLSKDLQAGFAFNHNESANIRGDGFSNYGFISVNNFAANPYQSFVKGSEPSESEIQRNYNQIFVSQKFLNKKIAANFLHQTSYETDTGFSKIGNRQNQISDLGFTYLPNNKSNFSISFGNLNEFNNNFLNSKALGAFETAGDVKTSYFKVSSTKQLAKNIYLISSFSEGVTKANGNKLGIFRDYSDIKSRSSSIGLIGENILGGKIGLVYSEPLRVYSGKASINIPVARDANGDVVRYKADISLKPQGKEQDIEIFFSKNLNDDSKIKFNFIAQKEAGNVKDAVNNYLGFLTYGKKF